MTIQSNLIPHIRLHDEAARPRVRNAERAQCGIANEMMV
jgi:hypothetical protein